jgi:hypothetical protein
VPGLSFPRAAPSVISLLLSRNGGNRRDCLLLPNTPIHTTRKDIFPIIWEMDYQFQQWQEVAESVTDFPYASAFSADLQNDPVKVTSSFCMCFFFLTAERFS